MKPPGRIGRVVAGGAIAALLSGGALSGGAPARTSSVGVGEREFRMSVYRSRVPYGTVRFNVRNFGEDSHNLIVYRRGRIHARSPEIRSQTNHTLTVGLRPGLYYLVCTVNKHWKRGMYVPILVTYR